MAPVKPFSIPTLQILTSAREAARADIKSAAQGLEAAFLAEMLAHADFEKALVRDSGLGGEGMAGFLVAEISGRLAEQEVFGIARLIERKLGDGK